MSDKIRSIKDLNAIRARARGEVGLREGEPGTRVTVHMGTCGIAAGARDILMAFMEELGTAGAESVSLHQTGCAGLCDQEPMVTITDKSGEVHRYGKLDRSKVRQIVREHIVGGSPVLACLLRA